MEMNAIYIDFKVKMRIQEVIEYAKNNPYSLAEAIAISNNEIEDTRGLNHLVEIQEGIKVYYQHYEDEQGSFCKFIGVSHRGKSVPLEVLHYLAKTYFGFIGSVYDWKIYKTEEYISAEQQI